MVLDKLLFDAQKSARLGRLPIAFGILPLIWLFASHKSHRFDERLPTHSGKAAPKLLSLISNCSRLLELPKEQRKFKSPRPLVPRWFRPKKSHWILFSLFMLGTLPVNLFPSNCTISSLDALENEVGIEPVNWLVLTEKYVIFGRFVNKSGGSSP